MRDCRKSRFIISLPIQRRHVYSRFITTYTFPRPNMHVSKAKRACFKCKTTRKNVWVERLLANGNKDSHANRQFFIRDRNCSPLVASDGKRGENWQVCLSLERTQCQNKVPIQFVTNASSSCSLYSLHSSKIMSMEDAFLCFYGRFGSWIAAINIAQLYRHGGDQAIFLSTVSQHKEILESVLNTTTLDFNTFCAKMCNYRCLIYAKAKMDVTYLGPSIAPGLHRGYLQYDLILKHVL